MRKKHHKLTAMILKSVLTMTLFGFLATSTIAVAETDSCNNQQCRKTDRSAEENGYGKPGRGPNL
jgi:hypothetical protein